MDRSKVHPVINEKGSNEKSDNEKQQQEEYMKMSRMKYTHDSSIHSVTTLDSAHYCDTFIIASDESSLMIWSMINGDKLLTIPSQHKAKISSVVSYVDDRVPPLVITGSWDEDIHVWPLMISYIDDKNKYEVDVDDCKVLTGHTNRIMSLKTHSSGQHNISHDGHHKNDAILLSGSADATIRIWSLVSLSYLHVIGNCSIISWVLCLDVYYSQEVNDYVVVSGGKDNAVRLWKLNEHDEDESAISPLRTIAGCPSRVVSLSVVTRNIAEPLVAVLCKNYQTILVYSLVTGKIYKKLIGHRHTINNIDILYSERYQVHMLVSASIAGNLRGWNPVTGELMQTFKGHYASINAVCMMCPRRSQDENIMISGMICDYLIYICPWLCDFYSAF